MTTFHPDLRRVAYWLPRGLGTPFRMRLMRLLPIPSAVVPAGLSLTEHRLAGGASVRVIAATADTGSKPVILWIHGGGYIMGSARQDDGFCIRLAQRTGATVVSVDYRLAPENPFPMPLNDCMAAYEFIHSEASLLGVDPARLVIAGQSAGGGLAAALTLLIQDKGLPPPRLQLLAYPMLDDRTTQREVDGRLHRMWNQASNQNGWRSYLGTLPGSDQVSDLAAPARRVDLTGLPPTWIGVGTADLFHDEDVTFAQRLKQSGVPTELEIVEGAYHGFDVIAPNAPVGQKFFESQVAAILQAIP